MDAPQGQRGEEARPERAEAQKCTDAACRRATQARRAVELPRRLHGEARRRAAQGNRRRWPAQLPRVPGQPRARDRPAVGADGDDADRCRVRADRLAAHAMSRQFAADDRRATRRGGRRARSATRPETHRRIRVAPQPRQRRLTERQTMPVAFRPPLEHPVEAPQAVHQADDSGNGDIFAAMLADAGKLPSSIQAAGAASADAAQESTGTGKDGEHHKAQAGADAFDPTAAFVVWPGMPLVAMNLVTQSADAGKAVAAGAGDAAQSLVGKTAVADALAQPTSDAAQRAADATLATDADPRAPAARHVPAPHARNVVPASGDKSDMPGAQDVQAAASKPADAASTPFALAAALLARTPDAKGAAPMGIEGVSAPKDRDAADPALGVNLAASAAPTPPVPVYTVAQPAGSAGFPAEAAGQIAQLVHINSERAQLHVHPAAMGPIDVTLRVHRGEVSVTMVAADAHTRAALEQSLPQLRDLLANQGLALTNASVNDQSPRDGGQAAGGRARGSSVASVTGAGAGDSVAVIAPAPMSAGIAIRRLVDLYA